MLRLHYLCIFALCAVIAHETIPSASALSFRDAGYSSAPMPVRFSELVSIGMPPISPVRPHPIIEPMPLPVHPIEIPPDIYLPMNVVDDGDDQFHQKGKWTVVPFAGNMGDFRFASPHKKK